MHIGLRKIAVLVGFVTACTVVVVPRAEADAGGTLHAHVTAVGGAPLAGICIDLLNPGGTNTAPDYVLETAPSDLTGLITQGTIAPGSYVVYFRDCGNPDPDYVSRFYGPSRYDEAKATPVSIVDNQVTNIGHTPIDLGGAVTGTLTDPVSAGPAANVSVTAWTSDNHLLAELYANPTCTDGSGHFSIAALPTTGVKLELANAPYFECGGDLPYADRFFRKATDYSSAPKISLAPDGTFDASATLVRAFSTTPNITSLAITGTVDTPTLTVRGHGFETQPAGSATTCPTETGDDGLVYRRGAFFLSDDTNGWAAGFGGDCIGLVVTSWTSAKIVFTLGAWYQQVGEPMDDFHLSPGDDISLTVKGTTFGTVATYGG